MILISRPKEQSVELKLLLNSNGYKCLHENFYNIKYYKKKNFYIKNNYYIFSSIHSVKSLIKNNQINKFFEARIFVVGEQVKKLLINSGCKNIVATLEDGNSLLDFLVKKNLHRSKLIHFCSNIANEDFVQKSISHNISIERMIVYKTIPIENFTINLIDKLRFNKVTGIVFYSKLAVNTFLNLTIKSEILINPETINMYCISERVSKPLKLKNFSNIYIAKKPNQKSLVQAIIKHHIV